MSLDLQVIAQAIADQLGPTGLNCYALPTPARVLPCIDIMPGSPFVGYQRSFGANGLAEVAFDLTVVLPVTAGWDDAYTRMFRLLGTGDESSIFDLLAADPTLGGVVGDATALTVMRPQSEITTTGESLLTAVFPLTVREYRGQ